MAAARHWRAEAELTLAYARAGHASRGDAVGCAGLLGQAVLQTAHAVLAERGEGALNEKGLAGRAGLGQLAARFARLGGTPAELRDAVDQVAAALSA